MQKVYMYESDLIKANAELIGHFNGALKTTLSKEELCRPGFYFFSHNDRGQVYARFYVGNQRSNSGLRNIASQLGRQRTKTGQILSNSISNFKVWYLPINKIKVFANAFGKGKIGSTLTRTHNSGFQNLEEINRMINDNFKFYAQTY